MFPRICFVAPFLAAMLVAFDLVSPLPACCPAPPSGKYVVNADQTVIILWDAATKTQHFIRQASFKSEADDFAFLIPSPTQPELSESGNEAFAFLRKVTEPEIQIESRPSGGMGCGCSGGAGYATEGKPAAVRVLEEKLVAGFNAVVLEADSTDVLIEWLKEHGYAFSPAVEAWAKPYVEQGWKITALKVAKSEDQKEAKDVAASALRMSFQTDRPLFPYREPASEDPAKVLGARRRLLRIYFLAEARYMGQLTKEVTWTGRLAWAAKLQPDDRQKALDLLKLPQTAGPSDFWLTEFEDPWPYRAAPSDLYFSPDPDPSTVKRPPILQYVSSGRQGDATAYALAVVFGMSMLIRGRRRS